MDPIDAFRYFTERDRKKANPIDKYNNRDKIVSETMISKVSN